MNNKLIKPGLYFKDKDGRLKEIKGPDDLDNLVEDADIIIHYTIEDSSQIRVLHLAKQDPRTG